MNVSGRVPTSGRLTSAFLLLVLLVIPFSDAVAGGKVGIYGLRLQPSGGDAQDYSDPGWGVGLHMVAPIPGTWRMLAGTIGFEYVNLQREKVLIPEALGLFYAEQTTTQDYFRTYLGARIGAHGSGFLRPFVGFNVAWVVYSIGATLSVPTDTQDDPFLSQSESSNESVFGYDMTLGVDLNFSNTVAVEGGVRYMKSGSFDQTFGEEDNSVRVSPDYFQFYLGAGIAFEWIARLTEGDEEKETE
jgi:hypothetical protein